MKEGVHIWAGIAAITIIVCFQAATISAEVSRNLSAILTIKTAILYLIPLLALFLAIAGRMSLLRASHQGAPYYERLRSRVLMVATIGLFILVPCAFLLHTLAMEGRFGVTFFVLQVLEFLAGLTNLLFLVMNVRDGRSLIARPSTAAPKSRKFTS